MQSVSQLLFDRVLNWLLAEVCLYKVERCGNDSVCPIQRVHDAILVRRVRLGPLGHVARKLAE